MLTALQPRSLGWAVYSIVGDGEGRLVGQEAANAIFSLRALLVIGAPILSGLLANRNRLSGEHYDFSEVIECLYSARLK